MTTPASRPAPPPIFIIGSPRSGTTLMRIILDSHPGISCGPESHFLAGLHDLAERHWPRVERMGFNRAYWDDRVRQLYETFQVDYMTRRGLPRWAEKTPIYTMHLDYIDTLFPTAQYVHIIRDARDVVASHLDRWGYRAAVRAPRQWAKHVEAGRAFGNGPGRDRYFELRYESLVAAPESVLRPMFAFLGEPWSDSVLEFDQKSRLSVSRRQEGGDSALIYNSRVGAGAAQLDPFLRALVNARDGSLLRELGYST